MGTHAVRRRQGIGRAMLAGMEAANTYAVGFYRKCGSAADEGEILVKEVH